MHVYKYALKKKYVYARIHRGKEIDERDGQRVTDRQTARGQTDGQSHNERQVQRVPFVLTHHFIDTSRTSLRNEMQWVVFSELFRLNLSACTYQYSRLFKQAQKDEEEGKKNKKKKKERKKEEKKKKTTTTTRNGQTLSYSKE